MLHDPMFGIALTNITRASEKVTAAREALAAAEAERDELILEAIASTDVRGARAQIARAAGLTDQRIMQIARNAR